MTTLIQQYILSLILICTCATAETYRVYVGEFDLSGDVPEVYFQHPVSPELQIRYPYTAVSQGEVWGYIPGAFRKSIHQMQTHGVHLTLEPVHFYRVPRRSQYLRVALWAETSDLSLIEPLIYHIPIHTPEDLEDYE
jgi:hypothetical protein